MSNPDLESRARRIPTIIITSGLEFLDPFMRAFSPDFKEAYEYGLAHGIFTSEDVRKAESQYRTTNFNIEWEASGPRYYPKPFIPKRGIDF
jgi:hypothetical protein